MGSAGLPSPWRIVASQHSGESNGYERQKAMVTKMPQAGSRRSIQFPDVWQTNFIGFKKSSKWIQLDRSLKYANDVVFCSLPCAWLAHGKWQNLGTSNKTMGASPNCLATHRTEQLYRQEEETSPTPVKAQLSNLESTPAYIILNKYVYIYMAIYGNPPKDRHHILLKSWHINLVGGWATPLKNIKVSWDDYSQNMEKQNACSDPPIRNDLSIFWRDSVHGKSVSFTPH